MEKKTGNTHQLHYKMSKNQYQNKINQELVDYAYKNLNNLPKGEEYEKMILSLPYDMYDPELWKKRNVSHEMALDYANIRLKDFDYDLRKHLDARQEYLKTIFGKVGDGIYMEPPFYVDYGCNISMGKGFYANFNCVFLDCTLLTFGDYVMCGPNVSFSTATHPTDPKERLAGIEFARPIKVGNNVWFGSNISVLPGVTIGDGAVIGAGAVVNKDVPANAVFVGVPGRVVRIMELEDDRKATIKEMDGK